MFCIGAAPTRPGIPLKTLDPPEAAPDGQRDEVVPRHAGGDVERNRGVVYVLHDARGRELQDEAGHPGVGDDHVRAAAEDGDGKAPFGGERERGGEVFGGLTSSEELGVSPRPRWWSMAQAPRRIRRGRAWR